MSGLERRSFLKLMGASLALAGLGAGGCHSSTPEHIVPTTRKQNARVPGSTRWYATSVLRDGMALGVLARCDDGRPTKLEGNPDHPASLGATDAITQAELLGLYDPHRSAVVRRQGRASSWEVLEDFLRDRLAALEGKKGAGLHVVLGPTTSPTLKDLFELAATRFPQAGWHGHAPLDDASAREAMRRIFGRPLSAVVQPEMATVVVCLDCDLFTEGASGVCCAHRFADARRKALSSGSLSPWLMVAEPSPTITGARADDRLAVRRSAVSLLARELLHRVAPGSSGVAEVTNVALVGEERAWLERAAARLLAAGSRALVVAGRAEPPAVHEAAMRINAALGSLGHTTRLIEPPEWFASRAVGLQPLASAIDSGAADTVVLAGVNPVFDALPELRIGERLRKLEGTFHFGLYRDETAEACRWHAPLAHDLESWGDARAPDGTAGVLQPLVEPLGNGRTLIWLMAMLAGLPGVPDLDRVREHWQRRWRTNLESTWRQSVGTGVIADTAAATVQEDPRQAAEASAEIAPRSGIEVVIDPDPFVLDGRHAHNAWLQELPRPLTRVVWGNVALMGPQLAQRLGVETCGVIRIEPADGHGDGAAVELPALVIPGVAEETIAVTIGHGRCAGSPVGIGRGVDVSSLRRISAQWLVGPVHVGVTGRSRRVVIPQGHETMAGRAIVREVAPGGVLARSGTIHLPIYEGAHGAAPQQWGMSIDLASCIGCGACVAACQAENNIPVVGPDQVERGREMHWIRVDRYFTESRRGAADIRFQPVPCMQCEDAPCELVCPTGATQHSADGLNDMNYARCIGTRYCSNNCPYKVRRFNFYLFAERGDEAAPRIQQMRNPRVTVRGRGVMEKCTYCVHRIRAAEMRARADNRMISDGAVRTACQQVCPTRAIVFGDVADPATLVSKAKRSGRSYSLLEELNTRPRTTYLADARAEPEKEGGGV
jgi:molybdopterin-containing oxidoreductase family iron-sulfur binding subunit